MAAESALRSRTQEEPALRSDSQDMEPGPRSHTREELPRGESYPCPVLRHKRGATDEQEARLVARYRCSAQWADDRGTTDEPGSWGAVLEEPVDHRNR